MTVPPEDFANMIADKISGHKEPLYCPKCGEVLPIVLVARFKERSRVMWRLVPAQGELLSGTMIGGSIEAMSRLLQSVGEDSGIPTEVLMEKCSSDENGAVEVVFLITRLAEATQRRKRTAERHTSEPHPTD